MNQIQIGRFIADCRKESNMTQRQIAEKLGITNRAVSKWETGKSMPDASLMLELCEALHISVNELLCGKRLNELEERKESEQITMTLTSAVAKTTIQKMITLAVGCFVWGYGIYMRIRLGKAINRIN